MMNRFQTLLSNSTCATKPWPRWCSPRSCQPCSPPAPTRASSRYGLPKIARLVIQRTLHPRFICCQMADIAPIAPHIIQRTLNHRLLKFMASYPVTWRGMSGRPYLKGVLELGFWAGVGYLTQNMVGRRRLILSNLR